jgi:purine-nucleoside phosphorylase
VREAASFLKRKLGKSRPHIAIVLGSSLGSVAEMLQDPLSIPFAKIPDFPKPTVSGHKGVLLAGKVGHNAVLIVSGRIHSYEKGDPAAMRPIIEALASIGVTTLILLNAAGSLLPDVGPGRLMLIIDHINLAGLNPLVGEKDDERFISLTQAYDRSLNDAVRRAAKAEAIELAEGTYVWFLGPSFETPAEIRAVRILGGDAVGMSTVPEVILARRFNLRVAAISAIVNFAAGMNGSSPSHSETLRQSRAIAGDLRRLLASLLLDHLHV